MSRPKRTRQGSNESTTPTTDIDSLGSSQDLIKVHEEIHDILKHSDEQTLYILTNPSKPDLGDGQYHVDHTLVNPVVYDDEQLFDMVGVDGLGAMCAFTTPIASEEKGCCAGIGDLHVPAIPPLSLSAFDLRETHKEPCVDLDRSISSSVASPPAAAAAAPSPSPDEHDDGGVIGESLFVYHHDIDGSDELPGDLAGSHKGCEGTTQSHTSHSTTNATATASNNHHKHTTDDDSDDSDDVYALIGTPQPQRQAEMTPTTVSTPHAIPSTTPTALATPTPDAPRTHNRPRTRSVTRREQEAKQQLHPPHPSHDRLHSGGTATTSPSPSPSPSSSSPTSSIPSTPHSLELMGNYMVTPVPKDGGSHYRNVPESTGRPEVPSTRGVSPAKRRARSDKQYGAVRSPLRRGDTTHQHHHQQSSSTTTLSSSSSSSTSSSSSSSSTPVGVQSCRRRAHATSHTPTSSKTISIFNTRSSTTTIPYTTTTPSKQHTHQHHQTPFISPHKVTNIIAPASLASSHSTTAIATTTASTSSSTTTTTASKPTTRSQTASITHRQYNNNHGGSDSGHGD